MFQRLDAKASINHILKSVYYVILLCEFTAVGYMRSKTHPTRGGSFPPRHFFLRNFFSMKTSFGEGNRRFSIVDGMLKESAFIGAAICSIDSLKP